MPCLSTLIPVQLEVNRPDVRIEWVALSHAALMGDPARKTGLSICGGMENLSEHGASNNRSVLPRINYGAPLKRITESSTGSPWVETVKNS